MSNMYEDDLEEEIEEDLDENFDDEYEDESDEEYEDEPVENYDDGIDEEFEQSDEEFGEDYEEEFEQSNEEFGEDYEEGSDTEIEADAGERTDFLDRLTSDAFTRRAEKIKISQIGFTDPIKKGRQNTISGLTKTVHDLGVLQPIHVMTVPEESEDENYKYILLDGVRRIFGALRNGQSEIDAIVWDFRDKDQGVDLALYISLLLNRTERRSWAEIWHLYQVLELQSAITPGTLEYLLQMESGDAMKLKDVMLCQYEEVKQALLNNEKPLEACYKMLAKLRKEEDRLAMEDETGTDESVEGAEELKADNTGERGSLSEEDVLELLEMSDLEDLDEVGSGDFNELAQVDSDFIDSQEVGDRHPIDPEVKQAVLQRDKFTCQCCGMKLIGPRISLIAIHHKIPVHVRQENCDKIDNLITLDLNCHLQLHVMERSGGSILMSEDDFNELPEDEQLSLRKILKLSRMAIKADKRKGLSKEDVRDATRDTLRHPMPGAGSKENQQMYSAALKNGSLNED